MTDTPDSDRKTFFVILAYPEASEGEYGDTYSQEVQASDAAEAVALTRAQCWVDNNDTEDYDEEMEEDEEANWADDLQVVYVHEGPPIGISIYPDVEDEEHAAMLKRHNEIDKRIEKMTRQEIARLRADEAMRREEEADENEDARL